MYLLIKQSQNHPGYDTIFVVASNGTVYALVGSDLAKATAYNTAHPPVDIGYGPDLPEDVFDAYRTVYDNLLLNNSGMSHQNPQNIWKKFQKDTVL